MKTNSLKILLVVLTTLGAIGTQAAPTWEETKSILKAFISSTAKERLFLPGSLNGAKDGQKCRNFMRDAMACSMLANGLISKNNNMSRIAIGTAGSLVGSVILAAAYAQEGSKAPGAADNATGCPVTDPAAAKLAAHAALSSPSSPSADATPETSHQKESKILFMIAWSAYFAGQNLPQIIDFAKDTIYRKNFFRAVWDTLCANRDRAEWAAIFVRNFGPLGMHYTPAGRQLSDTLFEIPGWAFQDEDATPPAAAV